MFLSIFLLYLVEGDEHVLQYVKRDFFGNMQPICLNNVDIIWKGAAEPGRLNPSNEILLKEGRYL